MDRDDDTKYQNLFSRIFEERIVLSERQAYLCTSSEQRTIAKAFCDVSRKDVKKKQKVKLRRAQGECLVTGSRRRT